MKKLEQIKKMVSNTPLIEIKYQFNNEIKYVYAKCEWYSLTGSIKDKVAYQILSDAYESNSIKEGDKIVEVSSGNMGLSLSAIANILGNPITILMPKNMSEERKKLIKMYGANLVETEDFHSAFDLCKDMKDNGYFFTEQFKNISNIKAHKEITSMEILSKSDYLKNTKYFVSGIGTSGTLSGIGEVLKEKLNINVLALEPENARIITSPPPYGKHQIQGISDELLPELFNKDLVDNVISISDNDAIAMAQKLCSELSLGVGISSGANFLGCVLSNENCITVFPDDNKKYLTTNLSIPLHTDLVDKIKLIDYKFLD